MNEGALWGDIVGECSRGAGRQASIEGGKGSCWMLVVGGQEAFEEEGGGGWRESPQAGGGGRR